MHSFYTGTGLGGDCSCCGTGFWTLVGLLTAVREDPAPAMLVEGHGMEMTGIRDCEETLWTKSHGTNIVFQQLSVNDLSGLQRIPPNGKMKKMCPDPSRLK